jgi:hypothetical protein
MIANTPRAINEIMINKDASLHVIFLQQAHFVKTPAVIKIAIAAVAPTQAIDIITHWLDEYNSKSQ